MQFGGGATGALAPMIQVEAGAKTPSGPSNSASASRNSPAIFGRISSTRSPQSRSTSPAGPSDMLNSTAWSRSLPIFSGRSQRCRVISSKPAILSCSLTVSAFAIENGPGPQVGSSVSSGWSRYWSTTCSARLHPVVVELAPPDDRAKPSARGERRPNVAQRLHRVGEEHDPHPREGVVEGLPELGHLDVADFKADVLEARLLGLLACGLDERLRDVDPDRLATLADQSGQPLRRVAEATAKIDDLVARPWRMGPHRGFAMGAEPTGDELAKANEGLEQRSAPGLDRLTVRCGGGLHHQHGTPAKRPRDPRTAASCESDGPATRKAKPSRPPRPATHPRPSARPA